MKGSFNWKQCAGSGQYVGPTSRAVITCPFCKRPGIRLTMKGTLRVHSASETTRSKRAVDAMRARDEVKP